MVAAAGACAAPDEPVAHVGSFCHQAAKAIRSIARFIIRRRSSPSSSVLALLAMARPRLIGTVSASKWDERLGRMTYAPSRGDCPPRPRAVVPLLIGVSDKREPPVRRPHGSCVDEIPAGRNGRVEAVVTDADLAAGAVDMC